MSAIDISYWQHHPDFAAVKASGVKRVLMRAADGEGGTIVDDSVYIANRTAARAVGLAVGSYFFNGNATTPSAAAAHQWSIIDWRPGDIVAVDIEGAAGIEWSVGQALEWCHWMLNQGVPAALIFVYMSSSVDTSAWGPVWALGVQPWIAQYGPNDGNAHTPPSVPWAMWQYTSVASCPGVVGNVDTNQIAPSWASLSSTLLGADMALDDSDKAFINLALAYVVRQIAGTDEYVDSPLTIKQVRGDIGYRDSALAKIQASISGITPGASVDLAPILAEIKALPSETVAAIKAAL